LSYLSKTGDRFSYAVLAVSEVLEAVRVNTEVATEMGIKVVMMALVVVKKVVVKEAVVKEAVVKEAVVKEAVVKEVVVKEVVVKEAVVVKMAGKVEQMKELL